MPHTPLRLAAQICAVVCFVFFVFAPGCQAAEKPTSPDAATSVPTTPKVGDKAADHSLKNLDGKVIRLSDELKSGPVVVVVLRGWPGYQCPLCTAQFGDLLGHAREFQAADARVLLVYPGPADGLREHAAEFKKNRELPANFQLLVDPDYAFSTAHGLRWDAPHETVYPATFVLDRGGIVRFARVSHEHGGRVAAKDILEVLSSLAERNNASATPGDH